MEDGKGALRRLRNKKYIEKKFGMPNKMPQKTVDFFFASVRLDLNKEGRPQKAAEPKINKVGNMKFVLLVKKWVSKNVIPTSIVPDKKKTAIRSKVPSLNDDFLGLLVIK